MNDPKTYRLAFVSNSAEIAAIVKAFADPASMDVSVRLATMEEAVPVAKELLASGVEVVLGGGATGKLLRQALDEPVVTIARTHLDVLRALIRAKQYGSMVGFTSFADPLDGLDVFENLLGLRIREVVFTSTPELTQGITQAVAEGASCIVGSGICREIASSLGKEAVVVTPSKDVILRALSEAKAIAASRRRERARTERLRIILESVSEGVIGVDRDGGINVVNRMAAEKLDLDPAQAMGRPVPDVVKGTGLLKALASGVPELDQIARLKGLDVVISAAPILVDGKIEGAVATFKPASRIHNISKRFSEQLKAKGFVARYRLDNLIGQSPAMAALREKAAKYAATDASLLIEGETGTGKEVLAQAVHAASPRGNRPFVAVNCSALSETLLESELFGYEEGAFTGAKRGGKPGLFELADTGTIFLDEIADIPPSLQVRLLRVLEEKQVMRVGGEKIIPVDTRVISSSHKDLARESRQGAFRADLYFRLAVLCLKLPPLRQRKSDIGPIAADLLARRDARPDLLTDACLSLLGRYDWPGNVREVDALLRRFALLSEDRPGQAKLLEELLEDLSPQEACAPQDRETTGPGPEGRSLREMVEAYEDNIIRRTLADSKFNRQETARRLGVSVNTLWRRLKEQPE